MNEAFALFMALGAAVNGNCPAISIADQNGALDDMSQAGEAVPNVERGKPSGIDWLQKGRVGLGNNPGRFRAILPWSAVFPAPGNSLSKARIEIREVKLLTLSRSSRTWRKVISSDSIQGGYYSKRIGHGLNLAPLPMSGSTIVADANYMTHFWPKQGRRNVDPSDLSGIFVSVTARMAPEDYAAGARYVMDAAADYWSSRTATWDKFKTNGDAGIGRMKFLTPEWRTFYMTTAKEKELGYCLETK